MSDIERQSVKIRHEDQVRDGTLSIRVYSSGERLRRGLTGLLGAWAVAGVTAFIPIAHFVLVPGFLVAGPILGWMRYRQDQAMLHVEGECPACGEAMRVDLEANERPPFWAYCPQCQASIQISK